MSGAHYIVGHARSRSPSPVSHRSRTGQRGSVVSESEDLETGLAAFRTFGSDGRPRRGSSRKSNELEPNKERSEVSRNPAFPVDNLSMTGRTDFLQVESDPQLILGVAAAPEGARLGEVRMSVPRSHKLITGEGDSGKPSSPDDDLSTASSDDNKRFEREMKQLSSGPQKGYGSFNEVKSLGTINGGTGDRGGSPLSQTRMEHSASTVNQEQSGIQTLNGEERSKTSYYTPAMVDELRKRNRLYFMDPLTKLWYFHGFPWKLTLQIIKVAIITAQIVVFGSQRQSIVEFFEKSNLAFKHLLLSDWESAYETMPYPPATGKYALYDIPRLYEHLNFAMEEYHKLPEKSLAAMELTRNETRMPIPIEFCYTSNDIVIYPNGSYIVHSGVIQNCTFVFPENGTIGNFTYDIKKFISDTGLPILLNRTLEMSLTMYVKTFHLNLLETRHGPTCYNDTVKIVYRNEQRSGQVIITLTSTPSEIPCSSQTLSDEAIAETKKIRRSYILLDSAVITFCVLSTILCARSLKRSNKLRKDTARFFKKQRNKPLKFGDHFEFINMWYVVIIVNDIFTIIGSAFKIQLETRVFNISTANYELCSMLLGTGVLLTYVGILRYLGFFKTYNVLILTLKTSFPHVIRFLTCAICLYVGFLFCGWTIFSPYNIKFRSLSSASECLFSLVNGDDMFVSFSALTTNSVAVWYMNRAYLYVFISLFIYVVISVFIAVIMDNYENLKNYYEGNRPDTVISAFMKEDGEMPLTEVFSHVRGGPRSCQSWFFCIFPCLACCSRRFPSAGGDFHTFAVQVRGTSPSRTGSDGNYLIPDVF